MKLVLVVAPLCLGLLLVGLSVYWVQLFPGTSSWTPEKAEQWGKVKDRIHNLSFIVYAPPGSELPARYGTREEVQAEYDMAKELSQKLEAEFESAYNTPRTTATVLKWSGVGLLGLGVVCGLALKDRNV